MPYKDPAATKAWQERYRLSGKKKAKQDRWTEKMRAWRKTPEGSATYYDGNLRCRYGITIDDYNALLERQSHACAICGKHASQSTRRLHVDHCHQSGIIRGLLCTNCNTSIGKMKDSPDLLRKAADYLEIPRALPAPKPARRKYTRRDQTMLRQKGGSEHREAA